MKDQIKTNRGIQDLAWILLIIFCNGLFRPAFALAETVPVQAGTPNYLPMSVPEMETVGTGDGYTAVQLTPKGTGGPTQPEVQSFTPIGVSDMVDPFTGDFSYNIPLMDVEGYPINIAYNSGVTMDQEASWVGLGWNLNVGAINRTMRGVPDDFNGDLVEKTEYQKPQVEIGINSSFNWELFGKGKKETSATPDGSDTVGVNLPSLSASLSFIHNNYTGFGTSFSFGPSFSLKNNNEVGRSVNLSVSGSSENGAGFTGSYTLSKSVTDKKLDDAKLSNSFSGGYNSRAGLTYLAYQRSVNESAFKGRKYDIMGSSYDAGLNYYNPSASPSFLSNSISGKLTGSTTWSGADVQWSAGITYNRQRIDPNNITRTNPAYGYFNLEDGQEDNTALLDFNRDDERTFTKYSVALPSAFLTNDIFIVQAQGISGSYRAFRDDIGYVFDPVSTSTSTSNTIGFELGGGNSGDFSVDLTNYHVDSYSGQWRHSNLASQVIKFEAETGLDENVAFQEAGERSVDTDLLFTNQLLKNKGELLHLSGSDRYAFLTSTTNSGEITDNNRQQRLKRNQLLSVLTIFDVRNHLGLNELRPDIYSGAMDYHIGEMTQLGTDGRRYVFGLPAYNITQEDVSFAIGSGLGGGSALPPVGNDDYSGMVYVNNFDDAASLKNEYGIDHSYSSQKMPAYAHSFMLTAVLSDDYIDSDGEKGPSPDDFGSYVSFDYEKINNVKWKSPQPDNTVFQNVGLKSDETDDRASFIYGEKEVWYVKTIKTKNYVAVFEIDEREDGAAAIDRSGGLVNTSNSVKRLKKISLYTLKDYTENWGHLEDANPLQEVHFEYDYSLCEGYPGNMTGGGKLTLKQIYFTYQGSYKLKRSSYRFDYGADDPVKNQPYNMKAVDRWGNYQATGSGTIDYLVNTSLNSSDFPYSIQDSEIAKENVTQWTLRDIYLPSGGRIHVDYESDDYAYVQHLQASQMYPIVKTSANDWNEMNAGGTILPELQPLSPESGSNKNRALFFKLKPGFNKQSDYFIPNEPIYFKCLVNMGTQTIPKWEYVTGYANLAKEVEEGEKSFKVVGDYGRVILEAETFVDDAPAIYNPVTKAGILFGRANMPRYIYDLPEDITPPGESPDENSIKGFANSVVNAAGSLTELFVNPNQKVYNEGHCRELITQHSFLRLLEPTGHKYGGGLRVTKIEMYDNWGTMINSSEENASYNYGQTFEYILEDGRSSGVASYEPVVGGDENTWKKGKSYQEKHALAPDKEIFLSDPIMESQFPSPSVGYSRIIISDIYREGVERTATGKVVKEFYTAKDFPTITKRTSLYQDHDSPNLKVATSFLPLVPKYDFLTASQGFVIETNDMHGKPKGEAVYGQGQSKPLSTVRYDYQKIEVTQNGISYFILNNDVTVIGTSGISETAEIGVKYDAVADFRESSTNSLGVGPIEFNLNAFMTGPAYMIIPAMYSKIDKTISQFRSSTLNKTINRFGILKKVTANQDGSIVETNNLAYDKETGDVLVTQTTTNFNDKIYSLSYPAHWKYDAMGQAYRNIGYKIVNAPGAGSNGRFFMDEADNHFTPGDEVKVEDGSAIEKAWVTLVDEDGIILQYKSGAFVDVASATITIIRSGLRNKQSTAMASITMLDNPLSGLTSDVYSNVINAGAVEFTDAWKTYCECAPIVEEEEEEEEGPPPAPLLAEGAVGFSNPYTNGTRGTWRPIRSYTYLTNRTQSHAYNNTNIRKDGVYTSFSPYYAYNNGGWQVNPYNWTFVSEVTNYSPNGMTLETRDALGRYSSSLFSFKNTLTTAVAVNAQQRQVAEGSFEDVGFTNCMDLGLFSKQNALHVSDKESHTGRNSIQVMSLETITYASVSNGCDDDADCRITVTPIGGNSYQVTGTVTASNNIISEDPDTTPITFIGGILTIGFEPGEYFEAEITLTDERGGCKVVVGIKSVLPDNEQLGMTIISSGQL